MTDHSEFNKALEGLSADDARAPANLTARVLSRIEPKETIWSWFQGSFWRPVYASALPLLLGFVIGINSAEDTLDPGLDDLLLADNQIESLFEEINRDTYE